MPPTVIRKQRVVLGRLFKMFAAAASSGAALVSILAFMRSTGLIDARDLQRGRLGVSASWVGVKPGADTAYAIGDTVHFAATATDSSGAVLVGVPVSWTSSSTEVATVSRDGTVIARGEGTAQITALIGGRTGRARVVVRQRLARMHITSDPAPLAEGEQRKLVAQARDARGQEIKGLRGSWRSSDTSVVRVDSLGVATGVGVGRATLSVTIDSIGDTMTMEVAATPAEVAFVGGDGQLALAGATLPQPIAVRVVSSRGQPVAGTIVRLSTDEATGTVDPATVKTNADGRATAKWKLGDMPGRQKLVASVDGVTAVAELVAEAEPRPAAVRVATVNAGQSAPVGTPVGDVIGVRLTDTLGRPLVDVPVSWATHDGGTLEATGVRTDTAGEASARWTLGSKAGTQRAWAYVGTKRRVPPAEVTAIGLAGSPASIVVVSGDNQGGVAGAKLGKAVVARILDEARNPVPNATVRVAPEAGTVEDTVVTTDSTGTATVRWTLGRTAGTQRIHLRAAGVDKAASFTARVRPAAAANLSLDAVEGTRSTEGRRAVTASVTDAFGNPVSGVTVRFKPSAGSTSPSTVATDEEGRAATRWTLGTKPGEQTLTASVAKTDARATVTVERPESTSANSAAKPTSSAQKPAASAAKPASAQRSTAGTQKTTTRRGTSSTGTSAPRTVARRKP